MSTISFIILNYNGFDETTKLVDSMIKWDSKALDFQIVIVDNCSSDDSFSRLSDRYAENNVVDVIQSQKNGGYSYGNNYGTRYAIKHHDPRYIAISNPDVELEQGMICSLLNTFDFDDRIGMCAPIMKAVDGSYRIYAQDLPTYEDDLKACSVFDRSRTLKQEGYSTLNENENLILTEMIPGSFFVVRADYFQKVGMFDESVFLYCEERIIGKKMKDAGYIAIKRADLFYVHAHSVTTKKAFNEINRWRILLNSRLYYEKEYLKKSTAQLMLLKLSMKKYLVELRTLYLVNDIKQNIRKKSAS